jgi:hypothetical protein
MKQEGRPRSDDRTLAREALQRAVESPEPDVDRLIDAVPGMLAEARRRRRLGERRDLVTAVAPLAWKAIPRLAAATALLLAIAAALFVTDSNGETTSDIGLDQLILTGSTDGEVADPLLEAIVEGEASDG